MRRPRASRQVVIAAVSALGVALFLLLLGLNSERWVDNPGRKASSLDWRISTALADTAVVLLSATLAYGPIRTLRGRGPAVHLPWRRSLGVAAGCVGLAHLVFGLSIHGDLVRPWESFVTGWPSASDPLPLVRNSRGLANLLGLTSAVLLLGLIAISRDRWLRRLGARRWKIAQRSTYVVFALVAAHAFFYWRVERRLMAHRVLVLAVMGSAVALQLVAASRVRRRAREQVSGRGRRPSPRPSTRGRGRRSAPTAADRDGGC